MQTYWAQIFDLPKKIMKLIEGICRTYLWTGAIPNSNSAFDSWEKICEQRRAGGINVINLCDWNRVVYLSTLL